MAPEVPFDEPKTQESDRLVLALRRDRVPREVIPVLEVVRHRGVRALVDRLEPVVPPAQERGPLREVHVRVLCGEPFPRGGVVLLRVREGEPERPQVERVPAVRQAVVVRGPEKLRRQVVNLTVVRVLVFEWDRRIDGVPDVRDEEDEHDDDGSDDVAGLDALPDRRATAPGRHAQVRPLQSVVVEPLDDEPDCESCARRERGARVEDEPRGRLRHDDRSEGPNDKEQIGGLRPFPRDELPQEVPDGPPAEEVRPPSEGQDDLAQRRGLCLRDRLVQFRLDEVPRPADEGVREGRVHQNSNPEGDARCPNDGREHEGPGIVPRDGEQEREADRGGEQVRRDVEPDLDLVHLHIPREGDEEGNAHRDCERDGDSEGVFVPDSVEEQLEHEVYEEDDRRVRPALPREGDRSNAECGHETVEDRGRVLAEEEGDPRTDGGERPPSLHPSLFVHRREGPEEKEVPAYDEEEHERVVVCVARDRPLEMARRNREKERGDEPRPPVERILHEGVQREDGQGAEERRREDEGPRDGVPRRGECGGDDVPGEEGPPVEQRGPRIREPEGVVQSWVERELVAVLERISDDRIVVERVGPARVQSVRDRGAVHEVRPHEQREPEDDEEGGERGPVRPQPLLLVGHTFASRDGAPPTRSPIFRVASEPSSLQGQRRE